ncbi:protein thylakoid assembly 8-like [Quercus suber]|uniref:Protein thylakoid assembly 8-like n=1 Tax=Quercus suber TaxID=58331 RepID=A0AAW0L464_QUESU
MRLLVHDLLRRRREIPQNAQNWKSKNLFSRDYDIGFTESILIVSSCMLKSIDWIFIDKGMINVFKVIWKQDLFKPDAYLYKDLIIVLAKSQKMDDAMQLWEDMRKENLFPDSQTYTEMIRGFLRQGSPVDAMNIYEDTMKSPKPPEELVV